MNGVTLTRNAYDQLIPESQLAVDGNETGGILLGQDLGMGPGFIIRHCGGPGPRAVRQPAHFQRDLAHAQMLAERTAEIDGSAWIGEWHTHLIELPTPSMSDLMTYRTLLLDPEIGFPRFLSLIMLSGQDGKWAEPRIYAWSISASSMRTLPVIIETGPGRPEGIEVTPKR